ncbi:DUF2171 domain-containing protein [Myxacorys almedinensis]|uniref:DUF2171 domain-containing protein n=1 Tax=Myxacorys almedinensis A TaxID=2690445 RepID=A0A8J7Z284_9CYAN|nr:DUF2171 domain-containing protein [Myxacorys almedinensis]NDJ18697.1 DUF2171 domain-containing protein [Myxacorys almedinensis A]
MDTSKIKANLAVYAEGQGGLEGASDVHIGNVDGLEGNQYVKFTKHDVPESQPSWFPVSWIRAIDENAIFLNKTIEEVASEIADHSPNG